MDRDGASRGRANPAPAWYSPAVSSNRRRLPLDLRDALIKACPARCARRPDGHRGFRQLRLIEGAGAHEDQVRPDGGAGEEVGPALRTEAPLHRVAAVGHRVVLAQLAAHLEGCGREAQVHRGTPGPYVLADPAPAGANDDGRGTDRITYRPAEAAAGDVHGCDARLHARRGASA